MRRLRLYLGVLILSILMCSGVWADYEEQVSLERNLEAKAQHLLDALYGEYMFSVVATVKLSSESWKVRYTELSKVKIKKKGKADEYKILPGFTAIKNLAPDEMKNLPFNSEITRIGGKIKKIDITLLASKEVPKKSGGKAEKILMESLGLNPDRGDTITTIYESFPIAAKRKQENVFFKGTFQNIAILVAVVVITLFLLNYIKYQKKQLAAMKEAAGAAGGGGGSKESDSSEDKPSSSVDMAQAQAQASTEIESMKQYFGFIHEDNVGNLMDILKKEKLGMQHLAIIVSFLEPRVASKVMGMFSLEQQAEIVKNIMKQKLVEKSTIEKMEKMIKGRMESLVGGGRVLTDILNLVNNKDKKGILDVVQQDPEAYSQIRPNVFLVDDLALLEDNEIKLLISELSMEVLSNLMHAVEQTTKDKLIANLSPSASAMLSQFIELKGDKVIESEVEFAQVHAIEVMGRLDREAKIELKKHLSKE